MLAGLLPTRPARPFLLGPQRLKTGQPVMEAVKEGLYRLDSRAVAALLKELSKSGLQHRAAGACVRVRAWHAGCVGIGSMLQQGRARPHASLHPKLPPSSPPLLLHASPTPLAAELFDWLRSLPRDHELSKLADLYTFTTVISQVRLAAIQLCAAHVALDD